MLEVDVNNILPVTDARAKIATLVDEVMNGKLYVLTRGGKPAVVVAPIEMAENALMGKNSSGVGGNFRQSKSLPIKVRTQKQAILPVEEKETSPTLKEELTEPVLEADTSQLPAQSSQNQISPIISNSSTQPVIKDNKLDDEEMPALDMNKINKAIEEVEEN